MLKTQLRRRCTHVEGGKALIRDSELIRKSVPTWRINSYLDSDERGRLRNWMTTLKRFCYALNGSNSFLHIFGKIMPHTKKILPETKFLKRIFEPTGKFKPSQCWDNLSWHLGAKLPPWTYLGANCSIGAFFKKLH
jgi:hypothetical protein